MEIEIRQGRLKDINKFLKFFREKLGELFPYYSKNSINYSVEVDYGPDWLKDKLKKGGKKVYLALKNENVVGYLLVSKSIAGVSVADWLAIDKKYQKKGIASKLIIFWEKDALKGGAHALQLWTTINNVQFYKNRGFELGGQFPKAWHGVNCYLIYKNLREPKEENFLKEYLKSKKK